MFFEPVDCTLCLSVYYTCDEDPRSSFQGNEFKTLPSPDMVFTPTKSEDIGQEDTYKLESHDAYDDQGHDLFVVFKHSTADLDENRPSDLEGTETGLIVVDYIKKSDEDDSEQLQKTFLKQAIERRVVQESITTLRRLFGECRTLNHGRTCALHCFWHGNICSYRYGLSASCQGLSVGQRCRCDFIPQIVRGRPVGPEIPTTRQNARKDTERRPRQKVQVQDVSTRRGGQIRRKIPPPQSPRGSRAPGPLSPKESQASNRVTRSKSKQASPETPQGPSSKYGEFPPELRALLLDYVNSDRRPATPGPRSPSTGYSKKS